MGAKRLNKNIKTNRDWLSYVRMGLHRSRIYPKVIWERSFRAERLRLCRREKQPPTRCCQKASTREPAQTSQKGVHQKCRWWAGQKLTSAADEMVRELEPKWQQRMEQRIKQQHSARQRNHLFPKTILLSLGGGLFLQTNMIFI